MSPTIQDTIHSAIADAREGDILAGKFRIESVLGHGGMGVVVAARHLQLDEKVAIKFLLPTALERPEAVARFVREAKAAIRIKSEHVVRVTDVGTLESGAPYMVMEYLEGTDLSQWLRQRGTMSVELLVGFMLQALEAIAEAHALGIIHRDLKPANLFCIRGRDGLLSIKVLDFGISKLQDVNPSGVELQMTAAAAMGSPLYMSPEQMRSARDVDVRTDIWSIGVIMYELLTGAPPFRGESLSEICVRAASFSPPPMRNVRPDLPLELRAAILKCLEKSPNDRFGNVAELAHALLPFAPKQARTSVERITRIILNAGGGFNATMTGAVSSAHVSAVSNDGAASRSRVGRRTQFAVVSLGVVTLVGGALWLARDDKTNQIGLSAPSSVLVIATAAATPALPPVEVYPIANSAAPIASTLTQPPTAPALNRSHTVSTLTQSPIALTTSAAPTTARTHLLRSETKYNAPPSGSTEVDTTFVKDAQAAQPVRPAQLGDADLFSSPH